MTQDEIDALVMIARMHPDTWVGMAGPDPREEQSPAVMYNTFEEHWQVEFDKATAVECMELDRVYLYLAHAEVHKR